MTTTSRTVAALALLSASVTACSGATPSAAYGAYRKAFDQARSVDDLKPFMDAATIARVDAAPPNSEVKSRFGSYRVSYKQQGSTVTVESSLSLFMDRILPQDYKEFRSFCVAADQALGHRLVVTP